MLGPLKAIRKKNYQQKALRNLDRIQSSWASCPPAACTARGKTLDTIGMLRINSFYCVFALFVYLYVCIYIYICSFSASFCVHINFQSFDLV